MAWLTGWNGIRIKVTVDKNKIDSDLTDFPLPVALTAPDIFSEIGGSWRRMAVTLSDGETRCHVEVKHWDADANEAHLIVKVAHISASADTEIYIYADGSHSDEWGWHGEAGTAAAAAVYDANYLGVWRLGESSCLDSSKNSDGVGYFLDDNDLLSGQFGKALGFNGTSEYVDTGVKVNTSLAATVSGLMRINAKTNEQYYFGGWPDGNRFHCGFRPGGNYSNGVAGDFPDVASPEVSDWSWRHFSLSFSGGTARFYINGAEVYNFSHTTTEGLQSYTMTLGCMRGSDGGVGFYSACALSDVSLSDVQRSAAWIKAEYAGFFGELISFGAKEDPPAFPEYIVGSYQRVSYFMTLGDIQLPFSSFQLSKSETKTRLAVVIPYSEGSESQIADRPDEDIAVNMRHGPDEYEIGRAELTSIRIDEGGENRSIALTGTSSAEYTNPNAVTLTGATYKNAAGGVVTYRFALLDLYPRPGDTLQVDGETAIQVTAITYSASTQRQAMEVMGV